MDPDVIAFSQVMAVLMASAAALTGIAVVGRILWRFGSRIGARPLPPKADSAELQRLQTAVDAIAIEVERISEAQRFTVTLLSNRLPGGAERFGELPARAPLPKTDTPN